MEQLYNKVLLTMMTVIFAHSFRCNFLIIMPRPDLVKAIHQPSNSGSGYDDGLDFIRCVGKRQPEIHEVWTFCDDRITRKVHPFVRVDISAFVRDCIVNDYLIENGRKVPMFRRICINGSFEWMGIPDFLRTNGPPWTANILAPYANWGRGGSSTS